MRFLLFGGLILGLMASTSSMAQKKSFCEQTFEFVCDDADTDRAVKLAKVKSKIRRKARRQFKQAMRVLARGFGADRRDYRVLIDEIELREHFQMQAAEEVIANFESKIVTAENIKTVKDLFKKVIDSSLLKKADKKKFKKIVDSLEVGTVSDLKARAREEDASLIRSYNRICGEDGFSSNAFTRVDGSSKGFILICPGWLITLNLKDRAHRLYNIIQVLAHEIAHHFDNERAPGVYTKFKECHEKHYVNEFVVSGSDWEYCWWASDEQCNKRIIESHADELVAETWSSAIMQTYIAHQGLSVYEAGQLIKESLVGACDFRGSGSHPSGKFSIENIIRKNPRISDYMGCAPYDNDSPWCGLHGQVGLY